MRYRLPNNIVQQAYDLLISSEKKLEEAMIQNETLHAISTYSILVKKYKLPWLSSFIESEPKKKKIGRIKLKSLKGINKNITINILTATGHVHCNGQGLQFGCWNGEEINIFPVSPETCSPVNTLIHELAHAWLDHELTSSYIDTTYSYINYANSFEEFDAEGCAIYENIRRLDSLELQTLTIWMNNLTSKGEDFPLSSYVKYWLKRKKLKNIFLESMRKELDSSTVL